MGANNLIDHRCKSLGTNQNNRPFALTFVKNRFNLLTYKNDPLRIVHLPLNTFHLQNRNLCDICLFSLSVYLPHTPFVQSEMVRLF